MAISNHSPRTLKLYIYAILAACRHTATSQPSKYKKNNKETTVNNIVAIHSGVVSLLFMVVSLFFMLLCFQFSLAHINILQQRAYLGLQVFNLHIALMQHVVL